MNVDSFFSIGSTHKVCQDYVIHGKDQNGSPYVILSDGCSSAPDTDFGARILCKTVQTLHLTQSDLKIFCDISIEDFFSEALRRSIIFQGIMNLDVDSLSATLIFLKLENNNFKVYSVGDCVIAAKNKDGSLKIIQYEFLSGAPYYLRYEHGHRDGDDLESIFEKDSTLRNDYLAKFGDSVNKKTYYEKDGQIVCENEKINFSNYYFEDTFSCDDYNLVAIMSDGASSFQQIVTTETSKKNVSVELYPVIYDLLAYKGVFGEFVQRRCQKVLKQLKNNGISHYDDFSIGAISINEK
jgi:hypothetical protein